MSIVCIWIITFNITNESEIDNSDDSIETNNKYEGEEKTQTADVSFKNTKSFVVVNESNSFFSDSFVENVEIRIIESLHIFACYIPNE